MRALSYSGLQLFNSCPSAFERRYILNEEGGPPATEETAPAMFRGTRIHNGIEAYLLGQGELPKEADSYRNFFDGIKGHTMLRPEMPWAYDKDWVPCDFDSKEGAIRGVMDATLYDTDANVVYVFEYKTGKRYPDHVEQLNLYGMAALLAYPAAEEAYCTTIYIDQQQNLDIKLESKLLPSYKWLWERRIARTKGPGGRPRLYPKRPSWRCRTCRYNAENGGKCVVPAKGD